MRRIVVRSSPVHGRGVFALANIETGTLILEYKGKFVSWRRAQRAYARSAAEQGHTFYFGLDDGRVIDGGQGGNSARWLNHSCAPNCEAEQDGERVFIRTIRPIEIGNELYIDYRLQVEGRRTAEITRAYACRCCATGCRGTMLSD
ncbi:SET domain-containing protein [Paraburkholderia hospita]|jgi:SET domain-containing protein|uniref:SET domain-containing protein n=1 Tax=Paraburkholderia hospita TaxID=169430 RepID=UPI000B84343D|nr:SET domain-containing protein [Paraburkholderia hospita]